jgi:hypothetical protein
MVYKTKEIVARAKRSKTNIPGTCQLWTRTQVGVSSAGDQDGDGDSDAVDGWKSEPLSARHTDRKPPEGMPVAWSGGRSGFGHRAISLGPDKNGAYFIRSTDAGGSGVVATVALDWVEKNWGLKYEGWSSTMTGVPIPVSTPPKPPKKTSRGARVDKALADANSSLKSVVTARKGKLDESRAKLLATVERQLTSAVKNLEKIPFIK